MSTHVPFFARFPFMSGNLCFRIYWRKSVRVKQRYLVNLKLQTD